MAAAVMRLHLLLQLLQSLLRLARVAGLERAADLLQRLCEGIARIAVGVLRQRVVGALSRRQIARLDGAAHLRERLASLIEA